MSDLAKACVTPDQAFSRLREKIGVSLAEALATGGGAWRAHTPCPDGSYASAVLESNGHSGWSVEVVSLRLGQDPTRNSGEGHFSADVIPGLLKTLGFEGVESPIWRSIDQDDSQDDRSVYFIGSDAGLVKIGVSDDPAKRLAEIQNMSPVPLRILATIPGAGARGEAKLHQRFAAARSHGEWFRPSPELSALIAEHGGES